MLLFQEILEEDNNNYAARVLLGAAYQNDNPTLVRILPAQLKKYR